MTRAAASMTRNSKATNSRSNSSIEPKLYEPRFADESRS